MIRLLFLVPLINISVFGLAQDRKPTKEETIAFIRDYFQTKFNAGSLMSGWYGDLKGGSSLQEYNAFDLQFIDSSCTVVLDYKKYFAHVDIKHNRIPDRWWKGRHIIELEKTESVYIFLEEIGEDKYYKASVGFKAAPGKSFVSYGSKEVASNEMSFDSLPSTDSPKSVEIPITYYTGSSDDDGKAFEKIRKAFDHLRKLCGAPEPISFD